MFGNRGVIGVSGYSIGRCSCLDEHLQCISFEHCEVAGISLLIAIMARYGYCFPLSFSTL